MSFQFQIIKPSDSQGLTPRLVRRYSRPMNGNGKKMKICGIQPPRGIIADRGKIICRIKPRGRWITKCIGPISKENLFNGIAYLNDLRQKIRNDELEIKPFHKTMSMTEALNLYLKKHGKNLTSKSTRCQVRKLQHYFKNKNVDQVTYLDVQAFRSDMEKEGYSISTANRHHAIIKSLFNLLKKWNELGIIEKVTLPKENPGAGVKIKDEKHLSRKRVLTPEEFKRLLEVSPVKLQRILIMAVQTLLRLTDLKNLKRDNINVSNGTLEGIQKKTGKTYSVVITESIKKLIDTVEGEYILDFQNFEDIFVRARKKSGILHFEFRDIRRTGARWMLERGIDISIVSAYLGHTSLEMTQRYVPSTPDHKKRGAEVLSKAFEWEF